ncbi:MAG TPA: CoA-binding protein [Elusimicrobia bacterium]|nr:MAG: hypothetical protein A2278_05140 [Elusimicrobia bacterium RIFOXYA12_FULL_49_49]OGS09276.1 MAG: hypothetical protein A2386_02485 [Elusimicrobia bacterium RIFOXYB1_FULL_48_9]OGS15215.1 MAG: hypothetical protein A2251_06870 [Elusimicrobia bacterium RIFOXYA2_FULL_47_53]OGS25930.1 MAG: hypothetical protein A2339_00935 [Elusimicrobia bacterium RIFOXYB12_FULL_50_12]OGS30266.1 MAG: hypothetical protein A2323_05445 [Elusimicrobia bacterium RIFOXYB2_FULL_46_23]HBU70411.1 CoA-binding protein [Elu
MENLKDKLIAVIGVSGDDTKYGHKIFRDLLNAGYKVEGVSVRGGTVLGRQIHKSLATVSPKPDLVITVVPPSVTEKIVAECIALGIRELWMQPGSSSDAAVKDAEAAGISVVRDSCIMIRSGVW